MQWLPIALGPLSRRSLQRRHGRIWLREPDHVLNRARRSWCSSTVLRRVPTAISVQELNARVLLNRRGDGGTETPWNLLINFNFLIFVHRKRVLNLLTFEPSSLSLKKFGQHLWRLPKRRKIRTPALEKLQRAIYNISAPTKSYQIELHYIVIMSNFFVNSEFQLL